MITDASWYACLFAGKSFAMQLWQQKRLQNLHHCWTSKWELKNGPKNGVGIWPPKWSPRMEPKREAQFGLKKVSKKSKLCLKYWVPLLGAIFGPDFGGQIPAPFLGPFFNPHFGVQKWCKFYKRFLLSKLHSKIVFSSKQTCKSKCICNHFPANCIFEHNSIINLVKPSKITTSFDCHKCCT